jgi:hypothetical protein
VGVWRRRSNQISIAAHATWSTFLDVSTKQAIKSDIRRWSEPNLALVGVVIADQVLKTTCVGPDPVGAGPVALREPFLGEKRPRPCNSFPRGCLDQKKGRKGLPVAFAGQPAPWEEVPAGIDAQLFAEVKTTDQKLINIVS